MTTARTGWGDFVATKKGHDFAGSELPELRAQTATDAGRRSAQLRPAVILHASSNRRHHDPAAFQAERHLAARCDARRDPDVLGDGDLSLGSDEHEDFQIKGAKQEPTSMTAGTQRTPHHAASKSGALPAVRVPRPHGAILLSQAAPCVDLNRGPLARRSLRTAGYSGGLIYQSE